MGLLNNSCIRNLNKNQYVQNLSLLRADKSFNLMGHICATTYQ